MSRVRRHESSSVQLFPFLAVLVSALGALVLLLLTIQHRLTQQSRALARQALLDRVSAEEQVLTDRRSELGHDIERLRSGITGLRDDESVLDRDLVTRDRRVQIAARKRSQLDDQLDSVRETRSDIELRIAALRQEIAAIGAAKARWLAERAAPDRTFVPVVHPGKNGTARRPIYVECSAEGVTFQPEGVTLAPAVLQRGGHELVARAVQALANYYLEREVGTQSAKSYKNWEPYPLILVRPNGCRYFYFVRKALEEAEFSLGYELIEGDWALQFPPPDPEAVNRLAAVLDRRRGRPVAESPGTQGGYASGDEQAQDAWDGQARTTNSSRPRGNAPATGSSGNMAGGDSGAGGVATASRDVWGRGRQEPYSPESDAAPATAGRGGVGRGSDASLATGGRGGMERGGDAAVLPGRGDTPEPRDNRGRSSEPVASPRREPFQVAVDNNETNPESSERRRIGDRTDRPTAVVPEAGQAQAESTAPRSRRRGAPDSEQGEPALGSWDSTTAAGKVLVPRNIELDCWDDCVVLRTRGVEIPIPESGAMHPIAMQLVHELDREVTSWGPGGMTFRWKPTLVCRVQPGGLATYHRLRVAFAGSSLELTHFIVAEDRLDLSDTVFLRRFDRAIESGITGTE